jgi:hypothetical protein
VQRFFIVVALVVLAGQAHALNKCTAADGKVSYQEAACAAGVKSGEIAVPIGPQEAAKRWRFSKERDAMTGVVTCFAYSPSALTNWSFGGRTYTSVYLQLAVSKDAASTVMSVRSMEDGGVFHIDTSRQGIKPDGGDFFPLVVRYGQHGLGVADGRTGALLGALQKSKSFTMRLRFWPYEKLHDTDPVSLAGFDDAVRAAMQCGL